MFGQPADGENRWKSICPCRLLLGLSSPFPEHLLFISLQNERHSWVLNYLSLGFLPLGPVPSGATRFPRIWKSLQRRLLLVGRCCNLLRRHQHDRPPFQGGSVRRAKSARGMEGRPAGEEALELEVHQNTRKIARTLNRMRASGKEIQKSLFERHRTQRAWDRAGTSRDLWPDPASDVACTSTMPSLQSPPTPNCCSAPSPICRCPATSAKRIGRAAVNGAVAPVRNLRPRLDTDPADNVNPGQAVEPGPGSETGPRPPHADSPAALILCIDDEPQ